MKIINKTGLKELLFTTKLATIGAGVIVLLCMPYVTTEADAQGITTHVNYYHGMSALAEKELRAKEQKIVTANKTHEESISASMSFNTEKKNDHEKSTGRTKSSEK